MLFMLQEAVERQMLELPQVRQVGLVELEVEVVVMMVVLRLEQ